MWQWGAFPQTEISDGCWHSVPGSSLPPPPGYNTTYCCDSQLVAHARAMLSTHTPSVGSQGRKEARAERYCWEVAARDRPQSGFSSLCGSANEACQVTQTPHCCMALWSLSCAPSLHVTISDSPSLKWLRKT